jgi:hypothetical protein
LIETVLTYLSHVGVEDLRGLALVERRAST